MKKLFLFCAMLSVFMFGCGNETSGTLSVSSPSTSGGIVTATAKYSPANGSALPNQGINFRWYTVGVTRKIQSSEVSTTGYTDNTGSATSQYTLPVVRTESFMVYVIASTGDMTNIEGWQSVLVVP